MGADRWNPDDPKRVNDNDTPDSPWCFLFISQMALVFSTQQMPLCPRVLHPARCKIHLLPFASDNADGAAVMDPLKEPSCLTFWNPCDKRHIRCVVSCLRFRASLYTNAQRQRQLGFVLDIRKDWWRLKCCKKQTVAVPRHLFHVMFEKGGWFVFSAATQLERFIRFYKQTISRWTCYSCPENQSH